MAQNRPGGGDPTEPPTPRRLQEARRRGEVARSTEVVSVVVFVVGVAVAALIAPWLIVTLAGYMRAALSAAAAPQTSAAAALATAGEASLRLTLPLVTSVALAALVAGYAQIGSVFSLEPIKPKLAKLNPLENLKQVFGAKALVELAKSLVKVVGVGVAAGSALIDWSPQISRVLLRQPEQILAVVGQCCLAIAWRVGLVVVVLAAVDLLYQRWSFQKKMRMTKEEVKREHKEGEGDPQHKAERQRIHRELLEQRMFERAAEADCVIINPKHVAVAISYDREQMDAPQVVARGRGLVAAKIRQIARQHGVPIVRNVPLARALVELELDDEIPGELYQAVAEVLRFVYRLAQEEQSRREQTEGPPGPPPGSLRA